MIDDSRPTVWEQARSRGVSRRDFLKAATYMTALLGLPASAVSRVVEALDKKPRPPVLWFHFQECTCCTESFIRASHPLPADILLDKISLDYILTLQAASGRQIEDHLHEVMAQSKGQYLMLVEGSIPRADGGVYCCIAGRTAADIIQEAAAGAKAVIAWGSCASNGCVQAASPNPTGATPVHKVVSGVPVINVPSCPPIADVMTGTIVHILTFDRIPQLDGLGRPRAFYSRRVHDTCYRRANYDAGLFVESFDDENAKRGFCLYKVGCRGPVTYNACGTIGWNDGVSYPIKSGHPCIGCSEADYFDNGPFYRHLAAFPGFGIETTADKVGLAAAGITAAGLAAHAVSTNIRKRKLIREEIEKSEDVRDERAEQGGK
jgi:hydrogenase small subunit